MLKLKVALMMCLTSVAMAHPGHGSEGGSLNLLHYLTEPLHFMVGMGFLACLVVVFLGIRKQVLRKNRIPLPVKLKK